MNPLVSASATPSSGGTSELVKDVTLANFMAEVIDASVKRPVIVDFWATWCGPCKQLTPLLEKLVLAQKGAVRLVKCDIDKNPEIAQQMQIQTVPAVFAFFRGQPVDGFMGAQPEAQLKQWIERLVKATGATADVADDKPNLDSALQQAADFLAAGEVVQAQSVYADILDVEPAHAGAYAGLLRCLLALGDVAAARRTLDQAPAALVKDKALAAVRTALELAEEAGKASGSLATLQARLAQDANDHQARFDLALAHYAVGEREAAVDALLEIVRRHRSWNEEAARKQLVKMFEAFGFSDPLAIAGRKRLSSLLFS